MSVASCGNKRWRYGLRGNVKAARIREISACCLGVRVCLVNKELTTASAASSAGRLAKMWSLTTDNKRTKTPS